MPTIGDTKTLYGRSYVYINPEVGNGPGTWALSSRDLSPADAGDDISISYGSGVLSVTSVPVIRGMLIYFMTNGQLKAAQANSVQEGIPVGVALNGGNPGQTITFTNSNILDFNAVNLVEGAPNLLEPGELYYLSSSSPGLWTTTPVTTTTGNVVIQCGQATGTGTMAIEIQQPVVV